MNLKTLRIVLEHQNHRLEVDTTLLGDAIQILQLGSLFQFYGEIQKTENFPYLRARFVRKVDVC
jgi:hypothetical protein